MRIWRNSAFENRSHESANVAIEVSGMITLENVRAYADAGPDLIRVDALTQSVKAMAIGFQIQPG